MKDTLIKLITDIDEEISELVRQTPCAKGYDKQKLIILLKAADSAKELLSCLN